MHRIAPCTWRIKSPSIVGREAQLCSASAKANVPFKASQKVSDCHAHTQDAARTLSQRKCSRIFFVQGTSAVWRLV